MFVASCCARIFAADFGRGGGIVVPHSLAFYFFHRAAGGGHERNNFFFALTCASSKEADAIANAIALATRAWHLRRAGATRHSLDQPASPLRLERLCSGASMHMDVSLACTSLCLCVETVIRAQHSHPSVIYEHKLKITIDASCTPALTSCTRVGRVRACVCACACTCLGVRVCACAHLRCVVLVLRTRPSVRKRQNAWRARGRAAGGLRGGHGGRVRGGQEESNSRHHTRDTYTPQ